MGVRGGLMALKHPLNMLTDSSQPLFNLTVHLKEDETETETETERT